ncbi:heterogeneous nuclear ribonucleoprotein C isoform X3 [Salmo trutta]|uniref:heterogeneous nuclear ribonucleoprotein C isoform X3 n=1 Tax=Salmo trutta TaxID=8032 RepID=UPI0011325048|nr:heterogeneous nuclear ribonucleoprotein C-like isoform X3 [Salmo trutta]
MTLFKSEYHSLRHRTMTGELRTSRPKTGTKRPSSEAYRSDYDLEYDSYPDDLYSSLHRSRDRPQGKRSTQRTGSSRAKLKMAELLAIKRELTLIKVQIDGLLDSVDKMDRQRKDHSDSPPTQEGSVSDSVSSLEDSPVSLPHRQRESPEPGEASDDDQHLQHYQLHCRINNHQSDLEDDM